MPKRNEDIVLETINGEFLLLDLAGGKVHSLNETSHFIWKHCDGTRSESDIAKVVSGTYQVDYRNALVDVRRILETCRSEGLIVY